MRNLIGFLLAVAAAILFFVYPTLVPFALKDIWANNVAVGLPLTETACWLLGITAAFGYLLWWVISILFRSRDSGFGSVMVLACVFGSLWYTNGAIDAITLGVTLGCGAYALMSEMDRRKGEPI